MTIHRARHSPYLKTFGMLALCLMAVSSCGSADGTDDRASTAPPKLSMRHGSAERAVTLFGSGKDLVLVDGYSGAPATVQVGLADGSTFRLDEALPLVGVALWQWEGSLIITGTNCPDFKPDTAEGTPLEDCGTDHMSVVSFDLEHHTFDVMTRDIPGEWGAGPVSQGTLLLNGGRAALNLQNGKVTPTKPYPAGSHTCPTPHGLLAVDLNTGDVSSKDIPPVFTATAFHQSDDDWSAVETGTVQGLLSGANYAHIAGCGTDGPLLTVTADGNTSNYVLGLNGDELTSKTFAEPTSVAGLPHGVLDASGTWLALTFGGGGGGMPQDAQLTYGAAWSTFHWQGTVLYGEKFAIDGKSITYIQRTDDAGWTLETGTIE